MFDFKKKVLGPLIANTVDKIDDALKMKSIPARIENLLSVKEDAATSFLKISNHEDAQGAATVLLAIGSLAASAGCLVASVGFGVPVAGALAFVALFGYALKKASNIGEIKHDAENLGNRIDAQVSDLTTTHPQQALKSPRFLKALKQRFNLASASETEVNLLRLALAPTPTIQPRATLGL
jgi:hypothetical protein